jgi:signal transduction histidine kinase
MYNAIIVTMVHKLDARRAGGAPAPDATGQEPAPGAGLRDVLAKLSHDLRTPLGAVLGYTDLLLDGAGGSLTPEQRRHLREVRRGGDRMLDILNRCLKQAEDGRAAP